MTIRKRRIFLTRYIVPPDEPHLIAHQTGTGVIVMRDGEVVEIEPDPEMYEGLE